MKKTIIAAALAAITFAAVSCSDKKEDKLSETENTTASEVVSTEDVTDEVTTEEETEDEMTKRRREEFEEAMERCADITMQELPEYDIPDDWHEINNGTVKMLVPSDVEETEKMDSSLVSNEYQNEDDSVHIIFHHFTKWDEGCLYDYRAPELSEELVAKALSKLGIDYDGTRVSMIKAITSFTSADKTEKNEEAYRIASMEKAAEFDWYSCIFHNMSDGHDVFIKGDYNSYYPDDEMDYAFVNIFSDSNNSYSVRVEAPSEEEILMMCSTLSFS